MIKMEIPFCNICHATNNILKYDFRSGFDNSVTCIALCAECGAKLREMLNKDLQKEPTDKVIVIPVIDDNGAYVDADVYDEYHCPICGEYVGLDGEETHFNFCPVCGQPIRWEKEE